MNENIVSILIGLVFIVMGCFQFYLYRKGFGSELYPAMKIKHPSNLQKKQLLLMSIVVFLIGVIVMVSSAF